MRFKVALAQMNSICGDVEKNLAKMEELVVRASKEGAKMVVFPEMCLSGYMVMDGKDFQTIFRCAETVDGPSVKRMKKLSEDHGIYIVFGMPLESNTVRGVIFNSAILVMPSGEVGVYRKTHLPTGNLGGTTYYEGLYCQAGDSFPVFDTELGRIGLEICYDFAFPEVTRILAIKGADIVINISAGPESSKPFFDAILPVRAMENGIFLIYVNVAGEQRGYRFFGHSRIFDPLGRVVLECAVGKEDFKVGTIDLGQIKMMRSLLPAFKDRNRRPEIYGELTKQYA
ncbi:MAG: carbon-nitrogen hydrolase family protein [Candidatus Baldrarchaeia archaeon]